MLCITPDLKSLDSFSPEEIEETVAALQGMPLADFMEMMETIYENATTEMHSTIRIASGTDDATGIRYDDVSVVVGGTFVRNGDRYVYGHGVAVNFDAMLDLLKETYRRFL